MPAQQPSPTYIHSLTTAFASTLDEIPQDMCRHFADLRELDAVLSQSLSSITTRIEHLTERIESGLVSLSTQDEATTTATTEPVENTDSGPTARTAKEEEVISMFQMLHEIADETSRIKLGGEDKIRVASLAAEHMNAYYVHLLAVTRRMCEIDDAYAPEILQPYTVYPHVPPSALVDPAPENRRGQPRRNAAVQNARNDSTSRMNGGDTPNKRRRIQGTHNYNQTRDVDTDDYSTPRRGPAALDADAYRPGGNTASKARTQNRKPRETRVIPQAPMDNIMVTDPMDIPRPGSGMPGGAAMQGVEPTGNMHNQGPVSTHKSHGQSGRGRSGVGSQQSNANPQTQPYPMTYGYGSNRNVRMPYEGQPGAPYDPMGPGMYPPNTNPMVDVYNHHGVMNMNPNLNHIPPSNYSHMNLPLPATLPPPPSGRTSSASTGARAAYEPSNPGVSSVPRHSVQNGGLDPLAGANPYHPSSTKSSHRVQEVSNKEREIPPSVPPVSGGLMPVPMLTSLPPVTALNQSTALSMPPAPSTAVETGQSRPRGYSHSAYNSGYGPSEGPNGGSGYSSHAQQGYQSKSNPHPSSHPSANFTTTGGVSAPERRAAGMMETHPSLSSSSGPSKDLPPLNTHIRDYATGGSSAGGGSASTMHASLARDPPFRTGSAGSGERLEREPKSASIPNRPRSGTVGAESNKYPGGERVAGRQVVSPTYPVEHGDSDRDQPPGSSARYSGPRYDGWTGGKEVPPMHAAAQSQSGRFVYGGKEEPIERFEDRDRPLGSAGAVKRPNIDHLLDSADNRPPERHDFSRSSSGGKPADGGPIDGSEERPIKAPVRRKPVDEDGNRQFGEMASSDPRDQDDDRLYCICNRPSFGEMIACDDSECEYEWFHLQCLDMNGAPPPGDFVCRWCKTKRAKGNKKPSKKKGTTGNGKGRNL